MSIKEIFLKKIFLKKIFTRVGSMELLVGLFKNIVFVGFIFATFSVSASAQVTIDDLNKTQSTLQKGSQKEIQKCNPHAPACFYNTETEVDSKNTTPNVTTPKGVNTGINQQAIQQKVQEKVQLATPVATPSRNIPSVVQNPPPLPKEKSSLTTTSFTIKNMLFDENIQDNTEPGTIYQNIIEIMPEITTKVDLSSIDVNRVVCPVDVKDVIYSKEKGLNVKIQGKNVFLKFTVIKDDNEMKYNSIPVDIYVVCGDEVYSMIAYPKRLPTQIIKLSRGKKDIIKKNMDMFASVPFEKKIMAILKMIFMDTMPDSFNVTIINKPFNIFQQINLTLERLIMIEGEGISVKEYIAKAKTDVYLKEKDFLRPDLTTKTVAISIGTLDLKKDETSKILIVEQRGNN